MDLYVIKHSWRLNFAWQAATKSVKIRDDENLHDVFKVHEKVLSCGQPHVDGEYGWQVDGRSRRFQTPLRH
jgi:hypothetical protein